MNSQCISIRSKAVPGERCQSRAQPGSEWCGHHRTSRVRFVPAGAGSITAPDTIEHAPAPAPASPKPLRLEVCRERAADAATTIRKAWQRWIARRAGPLLWARAESNNPFDFFSSDPVDEIPLCDFVSFVDAGKGYCMDIKSAKSLLDHATQSGEPALNPFNRAPLPPLFLRRVNRHGATVKTWEPLKPLTEEQRLGLAITDTFRSIEDLGYYTDPQWFHDLSRSDLQRLYIELADIWFHRAGLSAADRNRIVPGQNPFGVSVAAAVVMQARALRPQVLRTAQLLVSAAATRPDKQLGVMYVLGSLSLVSAGAKAAYPWLVEMFSPGVTSVIGNQIILAHPSVLQY